MMTSSRELPKTPVREKQEAPTEPQVSSDFAIPLDQLEAVTSAKEHVQELFSIKLEYGLQSKDEYSQMQWLALEGTAADLAKAKEYLKALCHPEMKQVMDIPPEYEGQLKDPEVCNSIEILSGAIIRFLPNSKVELSGSQTGVILAQSAIEDKLVGMMTINLTDDSDSDDDVTVLSSASMIQRQTSERLNDMLMNVCNHDDTIQMDEEGLTSIMMAPNYVKRALIGTLREPVDFDSEVSFRDVSFARSIDQFSSPHTSGGRNSTMVRPESPPDSVIDLKKGIPVSPIVSGLPLSDVEFQGATSSQRTGSMIIDDNRDLTGSNATRHSLTPTMSTMRQDPLSLHRFADSEKLDSLNIPDILDHRIIRRGNENILANLERRQNDVNTPTSKKPDQHDQLPSILVAETPTRPSDSTPEPRDTPIVIDVVDETITEDVVVDWDETFTEDQLREIAKKEGFALEDITIALQQFPLNISIKKDQFLDALKAQVMLKTAIEEDVRKTVAEEEKKEKEERKNQEHGDDVVMADDGKETPYERVEEEVDFGGASGPWTPVQGKTSRSPRKGKKKAKRVGQPRPAQAQQARPGTGQMAVPSLDAAVSQIVAQQRPPGSPGSPGWSPVQKKQRVNTQQVQPHQQVVTSAAKENQRPKKSWITKKSSMLRPVVIDGSNVAMSHGEQTSGVGSKVFSCRGLRIAVEYFKHRGHADITVFLPRWREENMTGNNKIVDRHILRELQQERHLVYTPSRKLTTGRSIAAYDDRYVIRLAAETGGIIVSNDYFRDLHREVREWREIIDTRVLMYSFVGDLFMPPDDPLGRYGPSLDDFLKKPQSTRNTPAQSPIVPLTNQGRNPPLFGGQIREISGSQIIAPPLLMGAGYRPPHTSQQSQQAVRQQNVPVANRFTALRQQPLLSQRPSLLGQPPSLQGPTANDCSFRSRTFRNMQNNPAVLPSGHAGGLVSRGNSQWDQTDGNQRAQERKELKKKLQEIYPDSDSKIDRILKKYPNEKNANLLCTYMLEEPDIT